MLNNGNSDKFQLFTSCFDDAIGILKSPGRLTVKERKMISEIGLYFQELLECVDLTDVERNYTEYWIENCIHILGSEFEGNFILQFHYFEKNYNKDPEIATQNLISVLVSLRAISKKDPRLIQFSPTVFSYLERDLPKFATYLLHLFDSNEHADNQNLMFLLINSIDTVSSLRGSEIFDRVTMNLLNIVVKHYDSFKSLPYLTPGSNIYMNEIVTRFNLSLNQLEIQEETLRGKPKIFRILSKLRNGDVTTCEELGNLEDYTYYKYLWWIAYSWIKKNEGENTIGVFPVGRKEIDVDVVFNSLWGNIIELENIEINANDLSKVRDFKDEDIKKLLYEYLIAHPLPTTSSRATLSEERDKTHGGGEISDFNFEIKLEGEKIWIAIPIKSAHESGNSSLGKMTQNYFYQMVRPIVSFQGKVVVFPIILTKSTLNTTEFLNLVRARLNLPILTINTELCAKILKKHDLLK